MSFHGLSRLGHGASLGHARPDPSSALGACACACAYAGFLQRNGTGQAVTCATATSALARLCDVRHLRAGEQQQQQRALLIGASIASGLLLHHTVAMQQRLIYLHMK